MATLEAALLQRLERPRNPAVAFAIRRFRRATSVAAVAQEIGLSQRTFINLFAREVGMTPKLYCRVRRFNRALRMVHRREDVDWAEVALACGYFDQPHMIRDFRAFADLTPSKYLELRTEHLNHVPPYLTVSDLPRLVKFTVDAFGGKPSETMTDGAGKPLHAEVRIGDSTIMIGQESEKWKARSGTLYVHVEDTEATYKRALAAGGTSLMEPAAQFYGDINAGVEDPLGNWWWIATRVEDVSAEEVMRRGAELKR